MAPDRTTEHEMRERCAELLQGVRLPRRNDPPSMVAAIRHYTRQPVFPRPVPRRQLGQPTAAIARAGDGYHLYYAKESSEWCQTRGITHEFAHLLLGQRRTVIPVHLIRTYGPQVRLLPDFTRHGHTQRYAIDARCVDSDDPVEQTAEMLAAVILDAVSALGSPASSARPEHDIVTQLFGAQR